MPELPEVERFRQLLLPLVSNEKNDVSFIVERSESAQTNKRIQLTEDDVNMVCNYRCSDVRRKGKQLALVLMPKDGKSPEGSSTDPLYLMLHMGMTGQIRVPGVAVNWGGKKASGEDVATELSNLDDNDVTASSPPRFTQLTFRCFRDSESNPTFTAYFCDPRKFGSCSLVNDLSAGMVALAPDALLCTDSDLIESHILPRLTQQRLGIKAILLDQKRAVSGVGNWVADEVLYQCKIHPDQAYLTETEARDVWKTLHSIVKEAVQSLEQNTHYPETWLFPYRWTKKKASSKDSQGRTLTFVTAGGRTSAILASEQKCYKRKASKDATVAPPCTPATKVAAKRKKPTPTESINDVEVVGSVDPKEDRDEVLSKAKRQALQKFRHQHQDEPKMGARRRSARLQPNTTVS